MLTHNTNKGKRQGNFSTPIKPFLHLIFNFISFVGEPTLNARPQHQQRQRPALNAHLQHQPRQRQEDLPSMLTYNTNQGKEILLLI
jgi:hypothetical protein